MVREVFDDNKLVDNSKLDLLSKYNRKVPHIIKYMGAKRKILDFVIEAIDNTYKGGRVCDLFGGTSVLSGALGQLIPIHSNDIQAYSSILAKTYLSTINNEINLEDILDEIINKAQKYTLKVKDLYPDLIFDYSNVSTVKEFVEIEELQQELINYSFSGISHYLFIKYYSGTYWSFNQCVWIDSLRMVAEDYKDSSIYYLVLSSLMFAMSYNSQSTGHFAQYRDAKTISSKDDILIYRRKEILPYFIDKFRELYENSLDVKFNHKVTTLGYLECLDEIEDNTLVYADPPYAFVHYSRFYHVFETLVKYDYPNVLYKGRYRTDRHQSPFCKRTEVRSAFKSLFEKIREKNADVILSYSNTGMLSLNEIIEIADNSLTRSYSLEVKEIEYKHSTMGRKHDKSRNVKEYLIIAKTN